MVKSERAGKQLNVDCPKCGENVRVEQVSTLGAAVIFMVGAIGLFALGVNVIRGMVEGSVGGGLFLLAMCAGTAFVAIRLRMPASIITATWHGTCDACNTVVQTEYKKKKDGGFRKVTNLLKEGNVQSSQTAGSGTASRVTAAIRPADLTTERSTGLASTSSETVQSPGRSIRPPLGERILGVLGVVLALPLGLRGFVMLFATLNASNSAGAGYALGGASALIVVAGGILKWSLSQLRTVPVEEYLKQLDESDHGKRHTAATALYRARWEPENDAQKLKILVEAQKYEEALFFGEKAIQQIIAKLKDKSEPTGVMALHALEKKPSAYAVGALIELLDAEKLSVGKGNIAAALKRMTGQDFGKDKDAWAKWFREINKICEPACPARDSARLQETQTETNSSGNGERLSGNTKHYQ